MLRMNREEREDVLRCFLLLLQPLRRNSLLSTVPKSPFTNKQTSKQTNISKQPNKLFTKNNVPPSNLVEIRIAEVFSCLFLIEALSKWQLCSHPAPSHAAIPECSRTAQALVPKKKKRKKTNARERHLQDVKLLCRQMNVLSCVQKFSWETVLLGMDWETSNKSVYQRLEAVSWIN